MAKPVPKDTPYQFPTTPGGQPPGDGNLSAQLIRAVFELNGAVGELRQAVNILTSQSEQQVEKLNDINRRINTAKTVLWIAGGAISILGAVAVFLLDKLWDIGFEIIKNHAH